MPHARKSGVEFVATVRARDKLSHLRTAMLCGGITPKEREALLNVRVEKLYIKPSTFEGLHNVVKEIIQLAHTACGLTGTYLL